MVIVSTSARAQDSDYLQSLLAKAQSAELGQQVAWRKILFYTPRWFRSDAGLFDSPAFYNSPDGQTDSQAELEATLRAFFKDLDSYKDKNLHPQCAFPARLAWLQTQLAIDMKRLPSVPCEALNGWLESVASQRLSLIFSSYYPDNPASMFGHTFIRLHRDAKHGMSSGLKDLSINFSAFPDTTNPMTYSIKGTLGFFPGRYQLLPYFVKVQEYNNAERRDLWQYELDYSPEEINMIWKSLWEIGRNHADYYYFDDNCSAIILTLLEVAKPSLELKSQFPAWVIPADTLRVVTRTPKLVRHVRYEPSILTRFLARYEMLAEEEAAAVVAIMSQDSALESVLQPFDAKSQVRILDATADYIDFEDRVAGTMMGKDYLELRRLVLTTRSKIPLSTPPLEIMPAEERPDIGHDSALYSLFGGVASDREPVYGLLWRPALHELVASNLGYPRGLEIGFFHTELRYDRAKKTPYLHDYSLLRVWSLPTSPRIIRKPAWMLDIASKAIWGCGPDSDQRCQRNAVRAGGGASLAFADTKVVLFSLALGEAGASQEEGLHSFAGAGLAYGAWLNLARDTKGLVRAEAWKRFGKRVAIEHDVTFAWAYTLGEQLEMRLRAHGTRDRQEVDLGFRHYY